MTGWRAFQGWMFGYGSPYTMGVVRALFGFLNLVNLLMISKDLDAWYSEKGFVPADFAQRWAGDLPRLNLLAGVTNDTVTALFFYGVVLVSALVMVGLFTRVSTVLLFVGLVTLHHRNPDILHSGDTMLRAMAVYLVLAPCGLAFSVDYWLKCRRAGQPVEIPEVSLWPQRLMQIQVAIVYFTTAWHKWQGSMWRDGTATWTTAQLHEFDRFPVPGFLDQQPFVAATTYGTLIVEVLLGTLVFWKPARKWVLLTGVLLHLSIEWRFNIPLFAWIMISSYVAFYEGVETKTWIQRVMRRFSREARTVPA